MLLALLVAASAALVDPLIGAVTYPETGLRGLESVHGFGKTFPGVVCPFGLVQLSPDTVTGGDNGPGYSYTHRTIEGFSFFHMSGIGWYGEFGNFQVMPGSGGASRFSHDEEQAEAGYYRVKLPDVGATVELTAAPRSGMIRITYDRMGTGEFSIDLARRIGELTRAKSYGRQTFSMRGPSSFEGEIVCDSRDGGWGRGEGRVNYRIGFRGICSKKLDDVRQSGGTSNCVVRARFPVTSGEQVVLHVAFSFDGLPAIPEGLDFDAMRMACRASWECALSSVTTEGGSEDERRIFATALYHAMIDPRDIGDGNGFRRRTVFSGWDVFRSEMPLLTLIRPDVVSDTISSMMDVVTSGRRATLPQWDIFGCSSGCMIGQPIIPVMATAYEAGIRSFDAPLALRLARESLAQEGNDRRLGFKTNSLSETLEFAYDDWCCGRLAEMLGEDEIARCHFAYAKAYTNCWSSEVGWMRTRTEDGGWLAWMGRERQGQGCVESNPWQQGWFVPHDIQGLMRLMGGRSRFTDELDRFFAAVPDDFRWNDAYNHPNEVCHFVPYLYLVSERPWRANEWVRKILSNAYGTGPFGLCGNEDCGQMSAWYVLSSIGLHPLCPGDGRWYVTAPLFRKTVIRLDPRFYSGRTFVVSAPKADALHRYVRAVRLNGRLLNRPWVMTSEIASGGELQVDLSEAPCASRSDNPIALTNIVVQNVLPFEQSATKSVMFACERASLLDERADAVWRNVSSREDYDALRNDLRAKMMAACGTFPERTPLNARTVSVVRREGYSIEKVVFESMPGIVVTANLFLPNVPRPCPAVVVSCGHTAEGKDCDEFLRTCVVAVKHGLAAFAFDPYEQGERRWHYVHNACYAHNQIGLRAALLDWSMPMLRIWDGMRAIDYVQSRVEIDPERIGYMGQSGGGAMTALMQVADRRIKVSAPSCYLTTFSSLCRDNGPQDAEQNIFGQLEFGLNHAGLVLIPDIPVAVTCKHSDFFRFYGTQSLYGIATGLSKRLQLGERYLLNDALGPHGWSEATRMSSVEFIANHLTDRPPSAVDVGKNRLLDYGFRLDRSDRGLSESDRGCFSQPVGTRLPGARSILDVIAEKAKAAEETHDRLDGRERARIAGELARIPDVQNVRFKEFGVTDVGEDLVATKIVAQYATGRPVPVLKIARNGGTCQRPALIVAASRGRREGLELAADQLDAGRTVYLVDVAGVGEVGAQQQHFYGCDDRDDEGLGGTLFLLGETLVGWRAGDLIALARHVDGVPDLLVSGPVAIAAAHAKAAQPKLWGELIVRDSPPSWKEVLAHEGRDIEFHYADLVPRAYLWYDWTDLIADSRE